MSTTYTVYRDAKYDIDITKRSAKFDLDIDHEESFFTGPQAMEADETIEMAIGILYAVWCSYPDKANEAITKMSHDKIPDVWNQITRARIT